MCYHENMKELRREIVSHLLVSLVYFFLVSLFNLNLGWRLLWFWLGALLGTFILDIDHLLLGLNPETKAEWAEKFRQLWQEKKYKAAVLVVAETHLEHRQLIFHSALAQPLLLLLAFFILSSTASFFGIGLVMSMNLHLLKDLWSCYFTDQQLEWFFWQVRAGLSAKAQRAYLFSVTGFFLLLTLLLL